MPLGPPPDPPYTLTPPPASDTVSPRPESRPEAILTPGPGVGGEAPSPNPSPLPTPGAVSDAPQGLEPDAPAADRAHRAAEAGPLHPIPFVLESRQIHLFNGSSGAGKTTFIGWLVGQLLTQPEVLGHPCNRPPYVAYVGGDRIIYDALAKLEGAGWRSPAHFSIVDSDAAETEAHVDSLGEKKDILSFFQWILRSFAADLKLPRIPVDSLIVVDSMSTIFGIEPAGSYLGKVAKPLLKLNRFCRKFKICVILIHHATKTKANDRYIKAQDRALGSMALQGFSSTQMCLTEPELTEDPDAGLTLFEWRSHTSPREEFEFRRSEATGLFEYIGPHWAVPAQKAPPVAAPAMTLLPVIPEEWTPAFVLKEQRHDIPKTTFYRYIDFLADEGLIERELRGRVVFVRRPTSLKGS